VSDCNVIAGRSAGEIERAVGDMPNRKTVNPGIGGQVSLASVDAMTRPLGVAN
jgi:hypothetical protein